MIIKNITGTSSYTEIEFDDKKAKFEGELLINGFLAYKDSLKVFDNKGQLLDAAIFKEDIIKSVLSENRKTKFQIHFE